MYPVLYSGFDSLDIAFKGAFSPSVLAALETARLAAEVTEKDHPAQLGLKALPVLVKATGRRGGFRYVFDNGPTGAIFAAKANSSQTDWNLFVSLRAACLLTRGYEGAKAWLHETLQGMEFRVATVSVNRFDYAIDILASDFTLNIANFLAPGQAKARAYWSDDASSSMDANTPKAILRGRQYESATIGSMPNRQVILYDKRREAIDKNNLHWFEAWKVDRHDPSARIWRVEIRAGRDALAKLMPFRTYEAIEAHAKPFLIKAASDIRYLDGSADQSNISRIPSHRIWQTVQETLDDLLTNTPPALLEPRALEIMRLQKQEMALMQGFGNLINYLILKGVSPDEVAAEFRPRIDRAAATYELEVGRDGIRTKAVETEARLAFLKRPAKK
tara:strand:+ start:425 stop:1591 length:1167 start_codon:yes stop_codon:yes gene_type:complete